MLYPAALHVTARLGAMDPLMSLSLPSPALALTIPALAPDQLDARRPQAQPPGIARIEPDTLRLARRTLLQVDLPALKAALQGVMAQI